MKTLMVAVRGTGANATYGKSLEGDESIAEYRPQGRLVSGTLGSMSQTRKVHAA